MRALNPGPPDSQLSPVAAKDSCLQGGRVGAGESEPARAAQGMAPSTVDQPLPDEVGGEGKTDKGSYPRNAGSQSGKRGFK